MTVRYYDRLNRFGVEQKTDQIKQGDNTFFVVYEKLIFPQDYLDDFICRYRYNPFVFNSYSLSQYEAVEMLFCAWNNNKDIEKSIGNMLYPSGLTFHLDFVLGDNDQNLIEMNIDTMDRLSAGINTIWMRDKPNGKTKQEVYDTLVIHFKRILANLIGVPDDLGQQNKGWQHSDLIEERFTSKPVESNNWESKD